MAYTVKAASNTFHVKDAQALREALEGLEIIVYPVEDQSDPNYVYLVGSEKNGVWPTTRRAKGTQESETVDLLALIAPHLASGEVAVLKQTGSLAAPRIGALAHAVNEQGTTVRVHIDEIYALARAVLGGNIAEDI
jgi:hypothetical protein